MPIFARMKNNRIVMAPLRGFTERPFREAFARCFSGVDAVVSPFIPLVPVDFVNPSRLADLLPMGEAIPLIPQVIGNDPGQIIQMAGVLQAFGYREINWNIGCPMKKITRKQRGSALLHDPKRIDSILEEVFQHIDIEFSVKTRLGFNEKDEFEELIPVFNRFPLRSLTIHTRTGAQMYEGSADPVFLIPYLPQLKVNEIIYNGDLFSIEAVEFVKKIMPGLSSWMIGRGLIANPFLGEGLKAGEMRWNRPRFLHFHDILFDAVGKASTTHTIHLNRMKGYWTLFSKVYTYGESLKDEILHARSAAVLMEKAHQIINNESVSCC
ncbi:MAG: tRNA-dihydrouridine synthase family protein [Bacteroidales bacterium]|nr:tRNA-dihydrouridine synthase family protein [Bacteroidales bacterium]